MFGGDKMEEPRRGEGRQVNKEGRNLSIHSLFIPCSNAPYSSFLNGSQYI